MRIRHGVLVVVVLGAVAGACGGSIAIENAPDGGSAAPDTGAAGTVAGSGDGASGTGGSSTTDGGEDGTAGTGGGGAGGSGGGSLPHLPTCYELGIPGCPGLGDEVLNRTPNMLLVIDKSGSMEAPFATSNKWEAMKSALNVALSASADRIAFGLELYPASQDPSNPILLDCGSRCCEHATGPGAINVPIEAGVTAVPKILSTLSSASPAGGTTTAAALKAAYDYFTTGAGASLQGDRFVLLATDGGPNCNSALTCTAATCTTVMDGTCPDDRCCALNDPVAHQQCLDDAAVMAQIEALKAAGISTFVVGIPGTEQYKTYLNQFAVAGGVPNTGGTESYFAVDAADGAAGLSQVFIDITRTLVRSCDFQSTIGWPSSEINFAINCTLIPPSSPDGSGWQVDETTNPYTLRLTGPLCDWIQTTGAERVDILYGRCLPPGDR